MFRENPLFIRERSFSTADSDVSPPTFKCPPVVLPSGTYEYSSKSPPVLCDIEQKLLRGMTVSVSMKQCYKGKSKDEQEWSPYEDCDCWLGYDKHDGFLFSVWNFATGELREICMMFVTSVELLSDDAPGACDAICLTCSLPPPDSDDEHALTVEPSAVSFRVKESSTDIADTFEITDLFSTLEQASKFRTDNDGSDTCTGYLPHNKKRASISYHGSVKGCEVRSPKEGSSSAGSVEKYPGVSSLIEKFNSTQVKDTVCHGNRSEALKSSQFGSIRNIFGEMDEVSDEDG